MAKSSTKTTKVRRGEDGGRLFQADEPSVEDFEDALLIDENALEEGITRQPDLFYRVSKIVALKTSQRDAAKSNLANEEAEADARLRRQKTEGRTTDKQIEAQKRIDPAVKKATDVLLEASHSLLEWQALKDAIVQRGHAFRELVELYVNNYYLSSGQISVNNDLKEVAAKSGRKAMSAERKKRGIKTRK